MRMKAEIPEGLDWSWIWPNGPLEAVAVQGFPELDALPIEAVLPLLLDNQRQDQVGVDKVLRRLRGVHYTPTHLVSSVFEELELKSKVRVFDPAMGAGVWLRTWLDQWLSSGVRNILDGIGQLYGFDIDPLAVAVTRFLLWKATFWDLDAVGVLTRQLRTADACLVQAKDVWSECENGFDLIVGNPPWLFLSGRGSPVAQYRRMGQPKLAESYQNWITRVAKQYPEFSKGCKDLAKWFVGLSLQQLATHGQLALVLPESLVRLPRYRDVRFKLASAGSVRVVVNPIGTFSVTSVSCVVFLLEGSSQDHILYRDSRHTNVQTKVSIVGSDWPVYRSRWAAGCHQNAGPRLGEWITIKEGVHGLYFEPKTGAIPVRAVDVSQLGSQQMVGTKSAFLKQLKTSPSHHFGERMVIRKTGATLCAAIVDTHELAYAHQNVYVGKRKSTCPVSTTTLVKLLNEPILTELYQQSPLGQSEQPMAQLRISALRDLPIPKVLLTKYGIDQ